MKTLYFTFGLCHEHKMGQVVLNKDCLVKIIAEDPREIMFAIFGVRWAHQYHQPPDKYHYKYTITFDLTEAPRL